MAPCPLVLAVPGGGGRAFKIGQNLFHVNIYEKFFMFLIMNEN
jgi:hypothetical protein